MQRAIVLCLAGAMLLPAAWAGDEKGKEKENGKELLNEKGKLSTDDPVDKLLKKGPHQVRELKMKEGKIYVIDLKSKDFDAFLRLEDSNGKHLAHNDDVAPGDLDSRLVFKDPKDDTYKIIATSYDGKAGAYHLTVREGTKEDLDKADPFYGLIGKAAPAIYGEFALNGQNKKIADTKGKVTLVDFWAVWCGPCIATFPHLRDWHKEFGKDLEIVGVTTYQERFNFDKEKGKLESVGKDDDGKLKLLTAAQEHDMLKDFLGFHKLEHRILAVSKENWAKASKDYRVGGIPHVALIDKQGNIRMIRVGSGQQNADDLHAEIKKLVQEK